MKKKPKANGHAAEATLRELPAGWQWVRLEDLASPEPRSITDGPFGSNLKSEHYAEAGPRVVRLENIGHGQFLDKKAHISQAHYRRLERHAVAGGDLVIAILGSPLPRACIVPVSLGEAIVKADCIRFKPDTALVDNRFACWWINSTEPQKAAEDAIHGVGRPRLGMQNVKELMVPLAPRPEQDRIVAKIDELFSDIEAGEKALEHVALLVKRYRQSVLKAAVTGELTKDWRAKNLARLKKEKKTGADLLADILKKRREAWEAAELAKLKAKGKPPKDDKWKRRYPVPAAPQQGLMTELPEGWVWASIEQSGEVRLGRQRAPQHHSGKNMRPYLRVANVYEDRLDLSDVKEMNFTPEEYETYHLRAGDILLNEGQTPELVGRPAMYRGEIDGCCYQKTLLRFRVAEGVSPKYSLAVFRHYLHSRRFKKGARITTSIAHLAAERFVIIEFPVPPSEEQDEIVLRLDEELSRIDRLEDDLTLQRQHSAALKQAILIAAFSGKLSEQDPRDEPADALIARIQAERNSVALHAPLGTTQAGNSKEQRRGRPKKVAESRNAQGKLL